MQKPFALRLFRLMFEEAHRARPPSRDRLGALLLAPPSAVDAALESLERAGLVNAERARLTMTGLAVAAATRRAVVTELPPALVAALAA